MKNLFILISLLGSMPSMLKAEMLSAESLYYRCYAHLTRSRPPLNDQRLAKVKAGTLNYVDACMQVFDLGTLNSAGQLVVKTDESIKVLENFNRFHMSWFDDVNVKTAIINNNTNNFLHDGGEGALHLTRALFHPDGLYKDVVTSNTSYQAIRSKGYSTYSIYPTVTKESDNYGTTAALFRVGNSGTSVPVTQILDPGSSHGGLHLQMGQLIGVMPMEDISLPYANFNNKDFTGNVYSASNLVSITKSFGGGILGTQPYLIINRPLEQGDTLDGGLRSGRVYGKQVFKEILCRDIPVVQIKDAIPQVDLKGTNPLPFRNGSSCMQCHSSIDPIGWATRDLRLNKTSNDSENFRRTFYFLDQYKAAPLAQEAGPVFGLGASTGPDNNFHKRPAKGRFFFRTFKGALISQPIQGLAELGAVISGTDDYYACASKKYFEFFTGHKVILEDETDKNARVLNDKEKLLRNFVIDEGIKLHQSQKVRDIIKDIISSDYYKTSDYEVLN